MRRSLLVNATYILSHPELIHRSPVDDAPPKVRRVMRVRIDRAQTRTMGTSTRCLGDEPHLHLVGA